TVTEWGKQRRDKGPARKGKGTPVPRASLLPLFLKKHVPVYGDTAGESHPPLCHPTPRCHDHRTAARRLECDRGGPFDTSSIWACSRDRGFGDMIEFNSAIAVWGQ